MLGKLFGQKNDAAPPEGLRLYAVGDVHGRADLLDTLIALIDADSKGADRRIVFLGDYIDRGPDSRGVIQRLLALQDREPETVFLKGNHEAAAADFLADPEAGADWLHWGGAETLESYGIERPHSRAPDELAAAFAQRLPAAHRAFLGKLELYRVFGDYLFVHAGVRPGTPIEGQEERDLLWIRGEFHNAPPAERPDKVVVHGHHPIKKALDAGWRIAVDTGACFTGRLTAVALEGTTRRFLST